MSTYSYDDYIYTAIGLIGASITSVSQIPNIIRFIKRFKSQDLSYTYQSMVTTGVLLLSIYYFYYKSLLVFPTAFGVLLGFYIISLKYYIEMDHTPREAMAGDCTSEDVEHKSLLEDEKRSGDGEDSETGYGTTRRDTLRIEQMM